MNRVISCIFFGLAVFAFGTAHMMGDPFSLFLATVCLLLAGTIYAHEHPLPEKENI